MNARNMSEPEAQHGVSPGAPSGHDRPPGEAPPRGKKPGSSRGTWIGIAGGLAIAGIAAIVILPGLRGDKPASLGEESTLEVLIPADINAALPTLDPGTSKAAVDDAKNCKAPLAWVTLTQQPGGHGGMVRVRSGAYLSPPIKLTPIPQRIAIPYHPKTIVIQAGGNDINAGKTPAQVLADFQAWVLKVRAALPEVRLVYLGQNPSPARWHPWNPIFCSREERPGHASVRRMCWKRRNDIVDVCNYVV